MRRYGAEPLDFSVNCSALGTPPAVLEAVRRALPRDAWQYPDRQCRRLREALAARLGVPEGWILCGGGAADLIFRLMLWKRPARALLTAPTFCEYEAALTAAGGRAEYFDLKPENGFALGPDYLDRLEGGAELAVLCNPNNPTGRTADPGLLRQAVARCGQRGVTLLVDECFNGFLDQPERHTLVPLLGQNPHLVLLGAFTKLYGMAGLRLGWCLCSDPAVLEGMAAAGPSWGVSSVAQTAGVAALGETEFVRHTRDLTGRERTFLTRELAALGLRVFPAEANYLLLYSPAAGLAQGCARRGVLVRSCGDYRGLSDHYLRVAVRTHDENLRLLKVLAAALEEADA